MSKAVLISIRPKWCELIASGHKTIEIRKTRPQIKTPFKCYIYCTKPSKAHQTICGCFILNDDELFKDSSGRLKYGDSIELMAEDGITKNNFLNGKVIGEFVCNEIMTDSHGEHDVYFEHHACVTVEEQREYAPDGTLYGWHISALKIYDKPKELSEFMQCHKCEYYSGCKEHEYGCNGAYKVTRPPQSFMYVEELP